MAEESTKMSDVLTAYGAFKPSYGATPMRVGYDGASAQDFLGAIYGQDARMRGKYSDLRGAVQGMRGQYDVADQYDMRGMPEFMKTAGIAYGFARAALESGQKPEDVEDALKRLLDIGEAPQNYSGGHCKTCRCTNVGSSYVSGKVTGSYVANTMKSAPGLEGKLGKDK